MYRASGAFVVYDYVSYKPKNVTKFEKIDQNLKSLNPRFMEGAFYLWGF